MVSVTFRSFLPSIDVYVPVCAFVSHAHLDRCVHGTSYQFSLDPMTAQFSDAAKSFGSPGCHCL